MKFLCSFCCKKKKNKGVYVIKLESNKYYVGQSNNINKRLWVHENGGGSSWTKKYSMVSREGTITKIQSYFWELSETLEQMAIHGIDNVRGSMFTNPNNLSRKDKIYAAQLFCEMKDLCRKCGKDNHYISSCNSKSKASWVSNFGGELEMTTTHNKNCINCYKDISKYPNHYILCPTCYKS